MLIEGKDREVLAKVLVEKVKKQVRVVLFTQKAANPILPDSLTCRFCKETEELLNEVAGLSDRIALEVHDFMTEQDLAAEYGIDKIPGIAIIGEKDFGIRFFGSPVGYEFATFIEDLADASRGETDLPKDVKARLKAVDKGIHLQVFVNPSCPYCPKAVRTAHQFAIESARMRADMVESLEFPHLVQKYRIMGVPQTIVSENPEAIQGAMPPQLYLLFILKLAGLLTDAEKKQWEHVEQHLKKAKGAPN